MSDKKLFESGELDMAFDTSFLEVAASFAKRFSVYVKVIQEVGSGGGWPVVAIVGELPDVVRCIQECWMSGDEETDAEVFTYALADGRFLEA